jgi:hypothetical protein
VPALQASISTQQLLIIVNRKGRPLLGEEYNKKLLAKKPAIAANAFLT